MGKVKQMMMDQEVEFWDKDDATLSFNKTNVRSRHHGRIV